MRNEYLECARICTAHGVKGLLKVEHYCDSASVLTSAKRVFMKKRDEYIEYKVKSASVMGGFVLLSLDGIDSREAAIAHRARTIYMHRDDIPVKGGAMLLADMIGLPVLHAETRELIGEIKEINEIAGRRMYSVKTQHGVSLLPDVPEFIKEITAEGGMLVLPIPGLFDEADEV
jgi:16S rRNA processing protein RimM